MRISRLLLVLLSTVSLQPSAFSQGSLSPPTGPQPSMITLDQLKPSIPIDPIQIAGNYPYNITSPGNYHLKSNITVSGGNAIVIATNGVTLDLNGCTISSTTSPASGTAILLNGGVRDVTIVNGHIRGGVINNSGTYSGNGFVSGIDYSAGAPTNVLVSRVSVSGCLFGGISLLTGDSTVVENCTVRTVGGVGISASTVKTSSAFDCSSDAISGDQVSDCRGYSASSGNGVSAVTAQNCYGSSSSGSGVSASIAQNCYGSSNSGNGVSAATALNCYGSSSGNFGVIASATAQNCYGSSSSSIGVSAATAQNCYGYGSSSGDGVNADTALNCEGSSGSGIGVYASKIATGCFGVSSGGTSGIGLRVDGTAEACGGSCSGGTAIKAVIGIGCVRYSGTNNITSPFLGTLSP